MSNQPRTWMFTLKLADLLANVEDKSTEGMLLQCVFVLGRTLTASGVCSLQSEPPVAEQVAQTYTDYC